MNLENLGEMVEEIRFPIICFDGGICGGTDAWLHQKYIIKPQKIILEEWNSYDGKTNVYHVDKNDIVDQIRAGNFPLPRWSNKLGWKYYQNILNTILNIVN